MVGVVRSRRHHLIDARPAAPVRSGAPSGAAAGAMIELQRTVGNKAVGRLVAHPRPAPPPVVQRQGPPGEYGLDAPASESAYVTEAVRLWRTAKTLDLEPFADKLLTHVVGDLKGQGVPTVRWNWFKLGASGIFDSEHWIIKVDVSRFSRSRRATKVGELSLGEVTEVIGTLYHEARHADQDVLIIRQLLDAKVPVADIKARTKIHADVVDEVKRTKYASPLDADEVTHARRMFDVMYGPHNQVLAFLIANTEAFDAIGRLARKRSNLVVAAPHVTAFTGWRSSILRPKVDAMSKATGLTPTEQDLLDDLIDLDDALVALAASWNAVPDKKKPSPKAAAAVRTQAAAVKQAMGTAYARLEGEADAFRIEADIKAAFKAADKAWKPPPRPRKKKK